MNTKQIRYVETLARVGSFSEAAAELGISQPSLSQYIKKIEGELGTPLFSRTGASLRLTGAGLVYLEMGRRMLDAEAQMLSRIGDLKADRTGVLRMGAAPFRTFSILPRAIARFRERYPGFTVRVTEATTAELTEGAERGEYDLCLLTLPVDKKKFVVSDVTEERLVIAVPAAFPVCRELPENGDGVVFSRFREVPFVTVGEDQVLGKRFSEIAADAGVTVRRAVVCINVESCLAMVRAGIGAALLPEYLVRGDASVRTYHLTGEEDVRRVVVLYRRGSYLSEPMKTMLALLQETPEAAPDADREPS